MSAVPLLAVLAQALQNYALAIWTSRNLVLHETSSSCGDILHASLNREITQLYALKATFSPVLQSYFTIPLDARLACSPRQRKHWLRLALLATSHASAYGTCQQSITSHFPHATSFSDASTNTTLPSLVITPPSIRHQQLPIPAFLSGLPVSHLS